MKIFLTALILFSILISCYADGWLPWSEVYDTPKTFAGYGIATPTIIPDLATPTIGITKGQLWYDDNLNKLRCYDGSVWQNLW